MINFDESIVKIIESDASQLSEERAEEPRDDTDLLGADLFEQFRKHKEESNIKFRETKRRRFF